MPTACRETGCARKDVLLRTGHPTNSFNHSDQPCQVSDASLADRADSRQTKRAIGDYRINEELQLPCGCFARVLSKTKSTADPIGGGDDVTLLLTASCCPEHDVLIKVSWSGDTVSI